MRSVLLSSVIGLWNTVVSLCRPSQIFVVVTNAADTRESGRQRAEGDPITGGECPAGAFDSRRPRWDTWCAVAIRMVALKLTQSAADAAGFRDERVEGVPRWMVHCHVFGELLLIACVVDAIAELLVATGLKTVVEEADRFEDLTAHDETTGGSKLLVCEILLDRKASVVVVASGECGLVGNGELNVTAHVVGVGCVDGLEGGFDVVFWDGHIGVDEREDVAFGVFDTCVAGGVGGLDLCFVMEGYMVVVLFIGVDDFWGSVGRVVVDDDDVMGVVGRLGE